MKPRRLLVVTESLAVWGAERSLLTLLKHLDRALFEPVVMVGRGSPLVPYLESLGIEWREHRFADYAWRRREKMAASRGFRDRLRRACELLADLFRLVGGTCRATRLVQQYDVILVFSAWQAAELALACKIRRVPLLIDVHETFSGRMASTALPLITRLFRGILAPSTHVLERCGISKKNALVLPRPIELNVDVDVDRSETFTVGMFGQVAKHKRVLDVVDAFARARKQAEMRLLVVGGRSADQADPYELEVRDRMKLLGSDGELVERVDDISSHMLKCDVVVNLSEHEAFGRSVAEALVCGCHPVVLKDTGPAEVVGIADCGTVLSSPSALCDELVRLQQLWACNQLEKPTNAASSVFEPSIVARAYFGAVHEQTRPARQSVGDRLRKWRR